MLREISQSVRDKPYDLMYMWNLMNKAKTINKIETEAWIHGTDRILSEGRKEEGSG